MIEFDEELYAAWKIENSAYYEYMAEKNGDPIRRTDLKNRHISPKRTREALARWETAMAEVRRLGGNPETIRTMLNNRPRSKD